VAQLLRPILRLSPVSLDRTADALSSVTGDLALKPSERSRVEALPDPQSPTAAGGQTRPATRLGAFLIWRRNEKFGALAYIRPMIRPLPLIAVSLGVLFLFAAAMYSLVPAGDLPSFFPGFEADGAQIHVKHAIGSLVIALALFAFAWRQVFSRERR
jgi:hypothetical protein